MDTIFFVFTAIVRWTMTRAEYDRRCRRFDLGFGFRWIGFDWFKPEWFGQ